jgi:hypothetical protein
MKRYTKKVIQKCNISKKLFKNYFYFIYYKKQHKKNWHSNVEDDFQIADVHKKINVNLSLK